MGNGVDVRAHGGGPVGKKTVPKIEYTVISNNIGNICYIRDLNVQPNILEIVPSI